MSTRMIFARAVAGAVMAAMALTPGEALAFLGLFKSEPTKAEMEKMDVLFNGYYKAPDVEEAIAILPSVKKMNKIKPGGIPPFISARQSRRRKRGVKRDWSYLEAFFRNLLLGENNEMKSRYLLIGLTEDDKRKIRELSEGKTLKGGQKKVVRKDGGQKTADRLLALLKEHPHLTQAGMSNALGINRSAIQKHLANSPC